MNTRKPPTVGQHPPPPSRPAGTGSASRGHTDRTASASRGRPAPSECQFCSHTTVLPPPSGSTHRPCPTAAHPRPWVCSPNGACKLAFAPPTASRAAHGHPSSFAKANLRTLTSSVPLGKAVAAAPHHLQGSPAFYARVPRHLLPHAPPARHHLTAAPPRAQRCPAPRAPTPRPGPGGARRSACPAAPRRARCTDLDAQRHLPERRREQTTGRGCRPGRG